MSVSKVKGHCCLQLHLLLRSRERKVSWNAMTGDENVRRRLFDLTLDWNGNCLSCIGDFYTFSWHSETVLSNTLCYLIHSLSLPSSLIPSTYKCMHVCTVIRLLVLMIALLPWWIVSLFVLPSVFNSLWYTVLFILLNLSIYWTVKLNDNRTISLQQRFLWSVSTQENTYILTYMYTYVVMWIYGYMNVCVCVSSREKQCV